MENFHVKNCHIVLRAHQAITLVYFSFSGARQTWIRKVKQLDPLFKVIITGTIIIGNFIQQRSLLSF